jgi:hypothetical protein
MLGQQFEWAGWKRRNRGRFSVSWRGCACGSQRGRDKWITYVCRHANDRWRAVLGSEQQLPSWDWGQSIVCDVAALKQHRGLVCLRSLHRKLTHLRDCCRYFSRDVLGWQFCRTVWNGLVHRRASPHINCCRFWLCGDVHPVVLWFRAHLCHACQYGVLLGLQFIWTDERVSIARIKRLQLSESYCWGDSTRQSA